MSNFGQIPDEVRYNNKLTAFARLMYIDILSLAKKENYCFANNKHFAELYNVSQKTVSISIKELEKNGCIKVEITKNSAGTYRKIKPLFIVGGITKTSNGAIQKSNTGITKTSNGLEENVKPVIQKCNTGVEENVKPKEYIKDNIEINIENNILENAELKNSTPTTQKKKKEKIEDCEYYFEFYQVINYLSEKTGATYRVPQQVSKFLKYQPYTLIKSLLKENYTYKDLNKVVEDKCEEWLSNPKMCVYLKPDTLFRKSNFENYLTAIEIKYKNKPKTPTPIPTTIPNNDNKPKYVPKPLIIKSV